MSLLSYEVAIVNIYDPGDKSLIWSQHAKYTRSKQTTKLRILLLPLEGRALRGCPMPSNRAPSRCPAPNSAQLVHTPTYFHISGHNSSAGPAPHQKYAVSIIHPQHHHLLHHNHHRHRPPRTTAQDSALADQSILPWSICLAI